MALPEYFQDLLCGLPLLTERQVELLLLLVLLQLMLLALGCHVVHLLVQQAVLLHQLLVAALLVVEIILGRGRDVNNYLIFD